MNNMYVTGDIHSEAIKRFENMYFNNDIVLICGDFGLPWHSANDDGYIEDEKQLLWLEKQNAVFAFIDGNHENFKLLNKRPVENWHGGKVHKIRRNIYHLMRGEIFEIGGYSFFTFGGALSTDKKYRTENITWWENEIFTKYEYENAIKNLEKVNYTVDFVITHTAPRQLLLSNEVFISKNIDSQKYQNDKTCDMLTELYQSITYKKWYFGHFHFNISNKNSNAECIYEKIKKITI